VLSDNPTLAARAIAIDLDGTLVDSAPDIAAAANAALAELGLPTLPVQQVRGMIGDGIDTLMERCLAAALGAAPEPGICEQARPLIRGAYARAVFRDSRIYPGVEAALTAWRKRGLRLACVTNKASVLAAPLLEQSGLAAYFDGLYCADERSERKPSPALLERFLADAGISAGECVMIGDSVHDMGAAHAAGVAAVAVDYGYGNPQADPAELPLCTVSSLEQLLH